MSSGTLSPSRLLLHPERAGDEGPCGYTLRLADENEVSVLDVLHLLGCAALGFMAGGQAMPWHQAASLLAGPVRFCPTCLSGKERWSARWEVPLVDACYICRVWLVDTCSSCYQSVTWKRPRLLSCKCGTSLHRQAPVAAPIGAVLLAESLGNLGSSQEPVLPALRGSDLYGAVTAGRFLGSIASGLVDARVLNQSRLEPLARSWNISSAAGELLIRWPESLWQLLDYIRSTLPSEHRGSLLRTFSPVYLALYHRSDSVNMDFIRSAFEAYVIQRWPGQIARRNRRLQNLPRLDPIWIRIRQAARISGRSERTLRMLVTTGEIASQTWTTRGGRTFLLLSRMDVERLVCSLGPLLTLSEASHRLGLTEARVAQLFIGLPGVSAPMMPGVKWAIPERLVQGMLQAIENVPITDSVSDQIVSLNDGLRYFLPDSQALKSILHATQTGTLPIVGRWRNLRGLSSLLFDKSLFEAWLSRERNLVQSLSMRDAAKRLGIKEEVAYFIARKELLRSTQVKVGRRSERHTSHEWIQSFEQEYLFPQHLAGPLKTTARALRDFLVSQGVAPIAGPGVDACRQVIFKRVATEQVLREHGLWTGANLSLARLAEDAP